MQNCRFESASNTACITVREIMAGTRPILEAHRDADGDWQFLPGVEVGEADAMVVSLKELLERDESVAEVADMKPGSLPPGRPTLHLGSTGKQDRDE